jgi:triosephosphate isomerase
MSRKPIIGGNWKCNPAKVADATKLVADWKATSFDTEKVDVVICPTALHISMVKKPLEAMGMQVSAQNVSKTDMGAFTGEWTAGHLTDLAVPWTLIGHSERRSKYGETDEETALKVEKCQAAGLKVILCIGELLEEREAGKTDEVNKRQLAAVLPKITKWDDIVIAYEPVWAIGTGKVATPDQAEETQAAIRAYIKEAVSADVADKVRIQYGGSVTPDNCAELIKKPNIDGFLVGGASLKPTFMEIITKVIEA